MAKTAQPSLEVEVVPIGALTLDPRNARKHGRRNLTPSRARSSSSASGGRSWSARTCR